MQLGYIGLGKMGKNMVFNLVEKGYDVVAFDVDAKAVNAVKRQGASGFKTLTEIVVALESPRVIWVMVPYTVVDTVLDELVSLLDEGDLVIDGGNSPYKDSMNRAKQLQQKGIGFLDVGVSGGPEGARNGACMMVGGDQKIYKKYQQLFRDLCVTGGYAYMGKSGAGHFVKMIHNGIEYGMVQSIAEGFDLMKTTKQFDLDLKDVSYLYQHGSVIESRLMGWMNDAFVSFGDGLKPVSPKAIGTGESCWAVKAAEKNKVSVNVIKAALDARERSQKHPSFQGRIIMAIRNKFGGHDIKPKKVEGK